MEGGGTDSFLARPRRKTFLVVFCGKRDGDGHLFWECTFHTLQHVRDLPEFAYRMSLNRSKLPRCLLWHGWLPGLNGIGNKDPWATSSLRFLPCVFPLGVYPGYGMGVVKGISLLLVISRQKDTSRCYFSLQSRSWASNAEEMEKIAHHFLRIRGV